MTRLFTISFRALHFERALFHIFDGAAALQRPFVAPAILSHGELRAAAAALRQRARAPRDAASPIFPLRFATISPPRRLPPFLHFAPPRRKHARGLFPHDMPCLAMR